MRSHTQPISRSLCLPLLLALYMGSTPLAAQEPATRKPATQKTPSSRPADHPQSKPGKKAMTDAQKKELIKILDAGGVKLDFEKQRVTVEARVGTRDDYIEYLLIGPRGKKHEGLFVTPAKASLIHAAMLALGYDKGVNAKAVPKDPFPTEEEFKRGVETHIRTDPKGQEVHLTVSWKDDKSGKTEVFRIQDLYHDLAHGGTVKNAHYVYIGSRMARLYKGEAPQYMADVEQNLISNYYVMPDNQLVTVVHEHAWDDGIWFPAVDRLPAKGHLVTFIFSRKPIAKPRPLAAPTKRPTKAPPGGAPPEKKAPDASEAPAGKGH